MSVTIERATRQDDEGIRRLLRAQPLPGRVRMAFCREPDFALGCFATGEDPQILVARSRVAGDIVGVACRSVRDVFLNGREQRLGYFGQLRVDDRFRGRWLVARGFAMLERIDREDPVAAYLASIVEGNEEALGILVRRPRRSFPRFCEVARYRTLAIPLRRPKRMLPGAEEIVPASADQVPDIVRFLRVEGSRRQLFPVWTEQKLSSLASLGLRHDDVLVARRQGAIVGTLALWDQSAYKQSIVRGYSGWLRALAPILPRVGQEVRFAYASLVCIAQDNPSVFSRLLRQLFNVACGRGADYLLVGLDARDPLMSVVRTYRHFSYPSRLYLASWSTGGHLHEPLDDRSAYVDIATL